MKGGIWGTRPYGGLKPTTPQNDAGMRIEPPMSEPVARVAMPAARAAPEPPEEPPGLKAGFQGLRVTPHSRDSVIAAQQNSGVAERSVDDPAGIDDALHAGRRDVGDHVLEDERAGGAGLAGHLDLVLDGDRDALERARAAVLAGVALFGRPGGPQGLVEEADGQRR